MSAPATEVPIEAPALPRAYLAVSLVFLWIWQLHSVVTVRRAIPKLQAGLEEFGYDASPLYDTLLRASLVVNPAVCAVCALLVADVLRRRRAPQGYAIGVFLLLSVGTLALNAVMTALAYQPIFEIAGSLN